MRFALLFSALLAIDWNADLDTLQRELPKLHANAFHATSKESLDASIAKRFKLGESSSLQFRSEFFNLLNRVNFAAPVQQISNPLFGTSTSQLLINNTQSRQVQFGLKLEF